MVTRTQVINNARRYLPGRIQSWTPNSDTHAFKPSNPKHTFHSSYTKDKAYDVMPYVFGGADGFDSGTQFLVKINNCVCPGGWDRRVPKPAGLPGRTTFHWYVPTSTTSTGGLGYGSRVPNNLAGIDCSGFALRCWGYSSRIVNGVARSTRNLPNLCLEVTRQNLKAGDILNWAGSHVRIFNAHRGAKVNIFESRGGYYRRAYRNGDVKGRVINRDIAWDDRYTPYSPFPQFQLVEPENGVTQNRSPTIEIKIEGSGQLGIKDVGFHNASIIPTISSSWPMLLSFTPHFYLIPGDWYNLHISAVNRIGSQSFEDEHSFLIQCCF